jgi:hypothetical protein
VGQPRLPPIAFARPRGDPLPAETHVEGSKPDRAAVVELVRNALAEILEVEPLQISEVSSFDDLGADSPRENK